MTTQVIEMQRKRGRPRSRKNSFQAVRVGTDTRRSLRMLCAEMSLDCIDDAVEALLECWKMSPGARQKKSAAVVQIRRADA